MNISYAQCYEDLYLMHCLGSLADGFYIDVGAGHPVYDNVSFAFYLRGWRGITIEPNPWLSQLSKAVRPRDTQIEALVGSSSGAATYFLVDEFHGLSTTIAANANAAKSTFGKDSSAISMPMKTLALLCDTHAPGEIDFLKLDVEGAERDVLLGCDFARFRPKMVVTEALEPVTLKPAWQHWEPLLVAQGYRYVFFDGLNRYYVATEHFSTVQLRASELPSVDDVVRGSQFKPALEDIAHPDHQLAKLLRGADMVRLPLLSSNDLIELLAAGFPDGKLAQIATPEDGAIVCARLFGAEGLRAAIPTLRRDATIRDLYRVVIESEQFRVACGRISASYAW